MITTIFGVIYPSAYIHALTPDLVFSTYLGGSTGYNGANPLTFAQNTACDALGNIYVTGATQVSDLPVLNAYQSTPAKDSTESAFVAKYNSAGQLLWCTYLGGNNQSMGIGVTATPTGGVAVVGFTTSNGSVPFPTTSNAFQSKNNGQADYFVTVFDAKGKLQYSTYLGGSGVEGGGFYDNSNPGNSIAVDANGRIYVAGMTNSGGGSGAIKFPVTANALQDKLAGSMNASLSILDPTKSGAASLVYSSFLGGDHDNQGHSVAVTPSGRYIAVGGFTTSLNFPTTSNAYRSTAPPGGFGSNSSNGFLTQFQSSQPGSASSSYTMRYSTYLGGDSSSARDDVYGMTMDASGNIVATGRTQSKDFPMTTGGSTIFNKADYLKNGKSGDEPYLVKIDPAKSGTASLVYSTFLGGGSASGEWGSWSTSVAVDARGAAYSAGETDAQGAAYDPSSQTAPQTFPYTSNAFLKAPQGSEDAMLMQINPGGDSLSYSTYLGGTKSDRTYGLAVDPDGNVVMTGLTFSSNFPAQNWPGNTGYQNAFVTVFSPLYTSSNLVIDGGTTYPVTGDITYDNNYIGQNSTGTVTQGGFTNTVNNNLKLGQNAGASGTYNLSGGSLSVGGNEYVGYSDTGSFTQSGGTHTVTGILMLAAKDGSSGTYNLSGGSLTVGNYETVGYSGTGSFTQSGGSHSVTALYLGIAAAASGTYDLSDSGSGSSLSVTGNEFIGYSGTGSFTQSAGTHTVDSNLIFGAWGGTGSYDLRGGSLSAGTITLNSGSTFTQSGGTLDFTEFNQSGGTGTFTDLYLGRNGGDSSTMNLSGGSVTAANEYVGNSGTGTLTQTGGTNAVTGTLTLAAIAGSSGTYNLQGGDLTAGNIIVNDSGSFTQTAGTLNAPITLAGGTLAAGTDNGLGSQTLTITSGTLRAAAGTTPSLGNAISVGGGFTLGGADNLTLSGAVGLGGPIRTLTITNAGDTTLSGTISNGGLSLNNTGGGVLTLSGANTYTGGTTLTAGTLLISNNTGLGLGGLTINGGTFGAGATGISATNGITVGGSFNLGTTAGNDLTLSSNLALGANNLTHSGAGADTLSGVVSGAGAITVSAGTLNLTGNNAAYSGTSTVTGGTLNLQGPGNYTGTNSVSGGTLNLNSASAITYSGTNTVSGGALNMSAANATYSGAGTVTDGTLNLSAGNYTGGLTLGANGIFNFTGGTFVPTGGTNINTAAGSTLTIAPGLNLNIGAGNTLTNSGTTDVNGTLTGNLTNDAGGTLMGSGMITGALVNNGTVNPGNSPGTLTVGTYTVNPGGTHEVEIGSASNYDRLITTAAGGITLNGGTLSPRLVGGFFPSTNQIFPGILQATGGGVVTGAFATIDNTRVGSSRTLFWQALYNPTSVDLKAVGNYTPSDMPLSRNQFSVGKALNSLTPSTTGGDLLTVLDAINALTTDTSVAAAYNEISPAKYAALPTLTMPVTHLQFQYLQNRLARERWEAELGSHVVRTGGGGFMGSFNFNYDNNEKMWLVASNMTLSDAGRPLLNKGVEQRWMIYLEPTANWGTQTSTANLPGYRYKNLGFTLGAEYWARDNLLVGVNTGYSRTLTGIGGTGGGINANVIPFNAYAAFFSKGFYANGTAGYTYSGYDLERNIVFGTINRTAQANTTGNQFQTAAEAGYDAKIGNAVAGPVLSLQYATQTTGGFTESNAGALNLKVGSQTADSLQSGVGTRASYKARVGNVTVRPQLSVTWQHEFSDNTRGLNASLAAGGSTMTFRTGRIGQDFALISADIPAQVTKNLVAYGGYTAEVGRSNSTNQGVNLGLKVKF